VKVIYEPEAKVFRRIFKGTDRGEGSHAIARALNREGIPAPYDKLGYSKPAGHGWSHTTIRNIIRNEHYIGIVTWGTTRWDRRGKHKRRSPRPNEDGEGVIRKEYPKLRIIPQALWDRVQARLGEPKRLGKPRTARPSALSGLLVCGVCGNNMSFVGNSKGGSGSGLYRNIKCSANHTKGPEICPNSATLSEGKMIAALAAVMRSLIQDKRLFERFKQTFNRLVAEHNRAASSPDPGTAGLDTEIKKQEAKVEKLAGLATTNEDIESLLKLLRAEEAKLPEHRARRAEVALPTRPRSKALPAPAAARLRALFEEVEAALYAAPAQGQVALRARLGKVELTPRESVYEPRTTLKTGPAALVEDGRKYALTGIAGAGFEPATFGL